MHTKYIRLNRRFVSVASWSMIVAAVTVAATGCQPGAGPGTSTTDSAGVAMATAAGEDHPLGWGLRVSWELPTDLEFFELAPHHVAVLEDGRLALLDTQAHRLIVLNLGDGSREVFGRKGEGPGELDRPHAIAVAADSLVIMDSGRGGLLFWNETGEVRTERVEADFWGPGIRRMNGATLYVRLPGSSTTEQELVLDRAGQFESVVTLRREPDRPGGRSKCGFEGFPISPLFAPELAWDSHSGTVAAVSGSEYRIEIHDLGRGLQRVLRRHLRPLDPTRDLVRAEISGDGYTFSTIAGTCEVSVDDLIEWRGTAETVQLIRWIAVMPNGEIWVTRRSELVGTFLVDVWSPGGVYLGSLTIDGGMPIAGLPTGEVVIVGRDDLLGPILRVLDVDRARALTETPSRERDSGKTLLGRRTAVLDRPLGPAEFRDCQGCPVMVALPGGIFRMGAPDGEAPAAADPSRPNHTERAEKPTHEVTILAFAVGKYEVTFDDWERCVSDDACSLPDDGGFGRGERPVINIGRDEARRFVQWLSARSGESYRLLSEAEWEYAARGGTTTSRWWGNEVGSGNTVCDGCGSEWDNRRTLPVGTFQANPFGLYDMLGNVAEWVADCWAPSHYGAPIDGSPRIEDSPGWKGDVCENPVIRGGAYSYFTWTVRAAKRWYWHPGPWDQRMNTVGFRVARSLPTSTS